MNEEKKWHEKIPILQKLKNIKHIEIIIAVIFAVIIILIYLSSTGKSFIGSSTSNSQTTFEQRLSDILSDIEGAGTVSVFVNTTSENQITGIIVVASGADIIKVKLDILRAVQTVLSVPTTQIEILVGNK